MKKKIVCLLLALLSVLSVLILPLSAAGSVTTELRDFTTSDVDGDLIGSTYKKTSLSPGVKIESASDIKTTFPVNAKGEPSIIEVMEVGYSSSKGAYSDVSLYLWIYIPDPDFQPDSASNKVTVADAYDMNPLDKGVVKAEKWVAESYKQYGLRHVGTSSSGTVYKFVVDGFDAAGCISGGERRYNVSRFDLHYKGSSTAQNYTAGRTYICTGEHADQSYSASANGLDVLEIDDLYQTVFRYDNLQDDGLVDRETQINTVYFSIPSTHELVYGDLFSIKTDWRRYRSSPMIVASDSYYYEKLAPYVGKSLSSDENGAWPDLYFVLYDKRYRDDNGVIHYNYNYKYGAVPSKTSVLTTTYNFDGNIGAKTMDGLFWLFKSGSDGNVSPKEALEYYEKYAANKHFSFWDLYGEGVIQFCNPSTDETYGEKSLTILASENMDSVLTGYEYSGFWEKFLDLFLKEQDVMDIKGVNAIQTVKISDYADIGEMTDNDVLLRYLIAIEDVPAFRSFCKEEISDGNTVVVLHYAVSEYESHRVFDVCGDSVGDHYYAAIQDIFLDFTLIEMAFGDEYSRTVIPVSTENQNQIGGITSPGGGGSGIDDTKLFDPWEDFLAKMEEFLVKLKEIVLWVFCVVAVLLLILGATLIMKPINAVGGYISDKAEDARRRWEERREREERNKRWRK